MKQKLQEIRDQIDEVDQQLLDLLGKRAELVQKVGKLKTALAERGNFIRSGREANMMKAILAKGAGEFPKPALFSIWRSIISASLAMEGGLKVAMLRSKSFHLHKLIVEYFGSFTDYMLCDTLEALLRIVDDKTVVVLSAHDDWWTKLPADLKVFAKLHDEIYALARVTPEETGEDKTVVVTDAELPDLIYSAQNGGKFLYEIEGFHTESKLGKVIGNYA